MPNTLRTITLNNQNNTTDKATCIRVVNAKRFNTSDAQAHVQAPASNYGLTATPICPTNG